MWMIYGANGYSGELIAREAVERGERPVLAGRNGPAIEALARELECEARVFDLRSPDLSGVALVVHCAGPFFRTSGPMVRACLDAGVHYLDITGEIAVFESIFARDAEAKERGIVLLPGVGFDVVPTDCLAAMLHAKLPDADELWLAFAARGGLSRGTLTTMIEGAHLGAAIRRGGRIETVPQLWDVREIPFPSGPRLATVIPWGDVASAWRTTGIPNIRIYSAQSRAAIRRIRLARPFLSLLRFAWLRNLVKRMAIRSAGPSAEMRARGRVELWGRVKSASGEATMTMTVAEGYAFTARSAVEAAREVLRSETKAGATTPALAFGPEFVTRIPGTIIG